MTNRTAQMPPLFYSWPLKNKKNPKVFNQVINRLTNDKVVPGKPATRKVAYIELKSNQQLNGYNTPQEYFCCSKSEVFV